MVLANITNIILSLQNTFPKKHFNSNRYENLLESPQVWCMHLKTIQRSPAVFIEVFFFVLNAVYLMAWFGLTNGLVLTHEPPTVRHIKIIFIHTFYPFMVESRRLKCHYSWELKCFFALWTDWKCLMYLHSYNLLSLFGFAWMDVKLKMVSLDACAWTEVNFQLLFGNNITIYCILILFYNNIVLYINLI